jgi:pimeloyl-ACP methyl ester carboxylesterase
VSRDGSTVAATGRRIHRFDHDGFTFDVLDDGPLDGPAVVLLHGFPERASHWHDVSEILHTHGLRTLALDQRGYSPGARPRGAEHYRMARLVGDVVALVEQYGAPVHLVGHDWGAAVAWTTASVRPDLVRTLTAVSVPHPAAFVRSVRSSDQALRSWYMLVFRVPGVAEWVVREAPGATARLLRRSGLSDDEISRFRREIVDDGALTPALSWYRTWHLRKPPRSSSGGGPRRVHVPTTLVWSDHDVALARRGAELTAEYVAAPYHLRILVGVSHWIPTQAPEALAEAIVERITAGDA